VIDSEDITPGFAALPIKLDDNGTLFNTMMVAGNVAMQVCDSGNSQLSETGRQDTVKPQPGWWMFIKDQADSFETPQLKSSYMTLYK
jgi:hypothetical protein